MKLNAIPKRKVDRAVVDPGVVLCQRTFIFAGFQIDFD